jgi:hypothetical protein
MLSLNFYATSVEVTKPFDWSCVNIAISPGSLEVSLSGTISFVGQLVMLAQAIGQ